MCSLCRLPVDKNHNFGQFLIFGGLLYRPPFTDEGQIWCARADPRSTNCRPNFIWMCSLCRLPVAKNHNFGQILTFWGLLYRSPFTNEGQIWRARADPRSTLTCQISSECVHCVGFRWPKTTILGKFWHFWGLLYRRPFTDEGQIWCAIGDPRCTLNCQISSRSVYSVVLWRQETPIFGDFCRFWTSAFSDVANWYINLRKLSTGAQLQTFPYPTVSKSFLYSNAFMAKSGVQTLTFTSVTDWQTNRQTNRQIDKKLNVCSHHGGGWNPSPTKLGMVIEDPEHVLAPPKLLGIWRIVSPLGGAENLGVTRHPQLKTPITP